MINLKVLGIDTSTKSISVAICNDDEIIGEYFVNSTLAHSCTLLPMIDNLLKSTKISLDDIDAFAVTNGPGSFTGVRIGVSTVKGMALALDKPCVTVSTLEAIAYNLVDTDCIAFPTIDARGGRVYAALFEIRAGKIKRIMDDQVIFLSDIGEKLLNLKEKIILLGDGADLCYNKKGCVGVDVNVTSLSKRFCRASTVATIGRQSVILGKVFSAVEIVPKYIVPSQAERERMAKLNITENCR